MAEETKRTGERESVLWSDKSGVRAWKRAGRLVVLGALALVIAAAGGTANAWGGQGGATVAPGLLEKASSHPDATLRVIVQSSGGMHAAQNAVNSILGGDAGNGRLGRTLSVINGVSAQITAKKLEKLSEIGGLV